MRNELTLSRITIRVVPDKDIFRRASNGDPIAFSEVYRRYQPRLYAYCLSRVMDTHAASDAAQEVFMRLLHVDMSKVDNPRAWLYGVARNVSVDMVRKKVRAGESVEPDHDLPAWGSLVRADCADEVLGRETARNIFLALRDISPRYRTALILRELHGQSSREIAEALGMTAGAVDTLVCRARDAFGTAYASVSNLAPACTAAVELYYRSRGTGISPAKQAQLDAHTHSCKRCQAEFKRAGSSRGMSALLPFMVSSQASGPLPHALLSNPGAACLIAEKCVYMPSLVRCAMEVAAVAIAAVLTISPAGSTGNPVPAAPEIVRYGRAAVQPRTEAQAATSIASGPSAESGQKGDGIRLRKTANASSPATAAVAALNANLGRRAPSRRP